MGHQGGPQGCPQGGPQGGRQGVPKGAPKGAPQWGSQGAPKGSPRGSKGAPHVHVLAESLNFAEPQEVPMPDSESTHKMLQNGGVGVSIGAR